MEKMLGLNFDVFDLVSLKNEKKKFGPNFGFFGIYIIIV